MNWCFNVYYTNLLAAELIIAQNQQLELFYEIPAAEGVGRYLGVIQNQHRYIYDKSTSYPYSDL